MTLGQLVQPPSARLRQEICLLAGLAEHDVASQPLYIAAAWSKEDSQVQNEELPSICALPAVLQRPAAGWKPSQLNHWRLRRSYVQSPCPQPQIWEGLWQAGLWPCLPTLHFWKRSTEVKCMATSTVDHPVKIVPEGFKGGCRRSGLSSCEASLSCPALWPASSCPPSCRSTSTPCTPPTGCSWLSPSPWVSRCVQAPIQGSGFALFMSVSCTARGKATYVQVQVVCSDDKSSSMCQLAECMQHRAAPCHEGCKLCQSCALHACSGLDPCHCRPHWDPTRLPGFGNSMRTPGPMLEM